MQKRNHEFERAFGRGEVEFFGVLVIGRRQFLQPHRVERLRWRREKVVVNSHKLTCITFDDLYDLLEKRIKFVRGIADRGDLS